MTQQFFIRVGDAGDYEAFGNLNDAVDYLNQLYVGTVTKWVQGPCGIGFETENYWGRDCISLFVGGGAGNFVRPLNAGERAEVEAALTEVLL